MGEWSKQVGEIGEDIVGKLIALVGWEDSQKGVEIPCIEPKGHARTEDGSRRTHGADFLFSYLSPLCDGLLDTLVISSKFSADSYPNSPTPQFKEHLADLTGTLHCYQRSQERSSVLKAFSGARLSRSIGVLFWLNNVDPSADVVHKVAPSELLATKDEFSGVYLIDNKRAAFLYDALSYAKASANGDEITISYIPTGKVLNPAQRFPSGTILPVEYSNLGLLPLRLESPQSGASRLMLFTIDDFSAEHLGRLMGLAQGLSQNFASRTDICFPDFDRLEHANDVQQVKNAFVDKTTTGRLQVRSFNSDFTT